MAVNETVAKCREEYGEAHDANMALSGECPWCGTYDEEQGGGHVDEATGTSYDKDGQVIEYGPGHFG